MLLCGWIICTAQAQAQTRIITGSVTDGTEAVAGATIMVTGTSIGTSTNNYGHFTLGVPVDATSITIKSIGMKTMEVMIKDKSEIHVVMKADAQALNEVVVTSIGTTKSARKVGYATTQVGGGTMVSSGESGTIQSLSGKASNVAITRNSGDPGAGAFIQIRGQSTITGNLQPLVIIDGIAVSNSSIGNGAIDGVVQQSRLNDLNPNDIESVEVLKGASAAAVWGTRAANGVIVITTKKGRASGGTKSMNVEFSSSFALDQVNREYEKQSTYGEGSNGKWAANSSLSWGDEIAKRSGDDVFNMAGAYFLSDGGTRYSTITSKGDRTIFNSKNRDQVFRNGTTWNNNLSISAANDKSRVFFSLSDWNQQGILNGMSDYRRTTGRLNYSYYLTNKLSISLNTFFSKVFSNRIQQGSNLDGLYLGYLRTPADFDNTDYSGTYINAAGIPFVNAHRSYRRYLGNSAPTYNNPGWTLNKQINTSDVTRFTISPEINYDWQKNSTLTMRMGYDMSTDRRITFFPTNSASNYANGGFSDQFYQQSELSLNIFDRSTFVVNNDLTIGGTAGFMFNNRNYYNIGGSANQFILAGQQNFSFINSTSANMDPNNEIEQLINNRVYAIADIEYKDKVFVQLTAASEAASTYKGRFFYPSASVAYEFTKDILKDNSILSMGKLRTSYGMVGVEPPSYIWTTNYVNSKSETGWGETLEGSLFGGSIYRSHIQGNPNIKPEQKTEIEFGADLKFFKNKFSLSGTYYSNKTTDAIFAVEVAPSTGFTSKWDNAATITNNGIEIDANVTVYEKGKLKWNVYGNWSMNRNMVEDLKGVKSIFLAGFTGTSSRAVAGQPLGVFWGGKFERDNSGKFVLDANGFPKQALEEGVLGNPNPNWRAGMGSSLSWNGLSVNVLFETSQGNQMWAGTYGVLNYFGINPVTANSVTVSAADAATIKNSAGNTIDKLAYATKNTDGSYTVRGNLQDFGGGKVLLDQSWYTGLGGGFGPVAEQFIVDASWVRLRELSLNYRIPAEYTKKFHIPSLTVGFTGRNLLLWTEFKGVDPELNLTGTSNGRGLDYFTNPGTKSYIFSAKFNF